AARPDWGALARRLGSCPGMSTITRAARPGRRAASRPPGRWPGRPGTATYSAAYRPNRSLMLFHWSEMAITEAKPNNSTDQTMVAVRNPVIRTAGGSERLLTRI